MATYPHLLQWGFFTYTLPLELQRIAKTYLSMVMKKPLPSFFRFGGLHSLQK